ncbi:Uncharacterised protein [Raoultella ornithinolytica]|nr:Uncharacterised protein [Raoultella ornithinolytica]
MLQQAQRHIFNNNTQQILLIIYGKGHLPLPQKVDEPFCGLETLAAGQLKIFTAGNNLWQMACQLQRLVKSVNIAKTTHHL